MPPLCATILLPLPILFGTFPLAEWVPSKNKPIYSLLFAPMATLVFVSLILAAQFKAGEYFPHRKCFLARL